MFLPVLYRGRDTKDLGSGTIGLPRTRSSQAFSLNALIETVILKAVVTKRVETFFAGQTIRCSTE
jgi:hypothetical protein